MQSMIFGDCESKLIKLSIGKCTFNTSPILKKLYLSCYSHNKYQVEIPTFDFLSSVMSIFQDLSLMKFDNLLYNDHSFMDPKVNNGGNIDGNVMDDINDIHTGNWFKRTHKMMIRDHHKEMICPIILYIDGVSIDSGGRKSLEPIAYTLGIFKRHIRNTISAWRLLGYIPNVEKTTSLDYYSFGNKKGNMLKKHHYHDMIRVILSSLKGIQKHGGILVNLPFGQSRKMIPMKVSFPVIYIIGDCIGNDEICGRIQNYISTKTQDTGISRDCNCTFKNSNKPKFKCNMISRTLIKQLDVKVMNRLGFHDLQTNAFDDLNLGHSLYGVNVHTPPEALHQWFLGVMSMIIEYFLDGITTNCRRVLEAIVRQNAITYSRQSDRNMPSIHVFKIGLEKIKLTGNERGSQLFMIWLSLLPLHNKEKLIATENKSIARVTFKIMKTFNNMVTIVRVVHDKVIHTSSKYNQWLSLFESMLSITEWLSCSYEVIRKSDLLPKNKVQLRTLIGFESYQNSVCRIIDDVSIIDEGITKSSMIVQGSLDSDKSNSNTNDDSTIDSTCSNFEDQIDCSETIKSDESSQTSLHNDPTYFDSSVTMKIKKQTFLMSNAEYSLRVFMKNINLLMKKKPINNFKMEDFINYYIIHIMFWSSEHQIILMVRFLSQ